MGSHRGPTTVKFRYTLKVIAGLAFLVVAAWITYWLLFQYQVRNLLGIAAIVMFLGVPSIIAVFKVPGELLALVAIWSSDDPAPLEEAMGDLRARDMSLRPAVRLHRLFRQLPKTNIPPAHREPVDPLYADINVEEIGVYQRYFDEIVRHVDLDNYTKWSMSREYDRAKMDVDDAWMYQVLLKAEKDGISGPLLQNMANQYFFADILERETEKHHWVRRVMHPHATEFFPGATQMRLMMESVSD